MGEILTKVLVVVLAVFVVCYEAKVPIERGKRNRKALEAGYLRAAEIHNDPAADTTNILAKSHRNRTLAWAWETGYMDYLASKGLAPDESDLVLLSHNPYVEQDADRAGWYARHSEYDPVKYK